MQKSDRNGRLTMRLTFGQCRFLCKKRIKKSECQILCKKIRSRNFPPRSIVIGSKPIGFILKFSLPILLSRHCHCDLEKTSLAMGKMIHTDLLDTVRGSGAVVKAARLENRRSRVRTSLWHSSLKKQNVSSHSLVKNYYCGEPP